MIEEDDYHKFAGKCKEYSEAEIAKDPTLRLAKGFYHCPVWGKRGHWWCVRQDGSILDPTVRQFPTNGVGAEYVEFDGTAECDQCGKVHQVVENLTSSNYSFCSSLCYGRFVGVL